MEEFTNLANLIGIMFILPIAFGKWMKSFNAGVVAFWIVILISKLTGIFN